MMKTTPATHRLPSDIIQSWQPLMESTTNEAATALGWEAIRYALPPVSYSALMTAITLYQHDQCVSITVDVPFFREQASQEKEMKKGFALSHPLFYAMTHSRGLSLFHDAFHAAGRRLLSGYFSAVSPDAEPGILYQDLQQTRDVLNALANLQTPAPPEGSVLDRYIVEQVNLRLSGRPGVSRDLLSKIRRFEQLYCGINGIDTGALSAKLPGVRLRAGVRRRSQGIVRRGQHDRGLTEDLAVALSTAPPHEPAITEAQAEAIDQQKTTQQSGWGSEIDTATYRVSLSRSVTGEALDESEVFVTRRAPSTLSRTDEQAVLRRARRLAPVDTLVSLSDIQRLTPCQISDTLTLCQDTPTAWASALLLLATGMPLQRLQQLTQVETLPDGPTMLQPDVPCWHPERRLMWYRLQNGPNRHADKGNDLVVLSLPESLNRALLSPGTDTPPRTPLRHAQGLLKRTLQGAFADSSGLRPLPTRLTSSSWLLIRPLARDDVAALALRGYFGVAQNAPAAYRQLAPGELNALFQSVLTCLMPDPVEPASNCSSLSVQPDQFRDEEPAGLTDPLAKNWITGSQHAQEVSYFRSWFTALQDAALSAIRCFQRPLMPSERSPDALYRVVTYSAAHSYLVFLLTTGCRPHGPRVRCELVKKDLWIADKNSATYQESRVFPAAQQCRETLQAHRDLLRAAGDWLASRGYACQDRRSAGQGILPAFYRVLSKRQCTLGVIPLDHQHFVKVLDECLTSTGTPVSPPVHQVPRNLTRHSVTTFLRARLPEPQLSAILGHIGGGFRQQAPGATSSPPRRGELQAAISDLLTMAGHSPLPIREFIHALRR